MSRGLIQTARFDLTACYDSLDHNVLCHFLKGIGCDQDFCDFLRECLRTWTATEERIYQNHGIPQGPLGSGLISEVVLQHFDQNHRPGSNLVYLRYVDDIRLFAQREIDLRRMLVRLDRLSKDVGLFPQASKIDIHRVINVDDELKSISNPSEAAVKGRVVDQPRLLKRLLSLNPRLRPSVIITDETRFRYLLAFAAPTSKLNDRMLKISAARPDLVPSVARYFKRYRRLPKKVAKELVARIKSDHLYEYITWEWFDVLNGRTDDATSRLIEKVVKAQWKPRSLRPELKCAIGDKLIRTGKLTLKQTQYAVSSVQEWWVRAALVVALNNEHYGTVALERLLNGSLREDNSDVSLAAATQIANLNIPVMRPFTLIQPSGGKALRQFGILARIPGRVCGILWSMERFTGRRFAINWPAVFGADYRQAETMAVQMRALADTNVSAFVNAADVFNDLLLSVLYRHDPALGTYNLGHIGSVLSSTRLRSNYPALSMLCNDIHSERLKSHLSHPVVKTTGKPTSRIPYKYLRAARPLYTKAFLEIEAKW